MLSENLSPHPVPGKVEMAADPTKALVADIGGTHARFAIADLGDLSIRHAATLPSRSFDSLQEAVRAYLDGCPVRPGRAAFGLAAPLSGETIRMTNLPWSFTRRELAAACDVGEVLLINDFVALAHAVPHLGEADLVRIGGAEGAQDATRIVLGPGTGLGLAAIAHTPQGWLPLPGEGGHAGLAARNARELAICEKIAGGRTHVDMEELLSGPGIARLYGIVADLAGTPRQPPDPKEIAARAADGSDALASETLALFAEWLGRFAGDMALAFGARGGVYLGGGIAPKILPLLRQGGFRRAFEDKGRMSAYVEAIPVHVILARDAALRGAAIALAAASTMQEKIPG